MSNTYKAIIAIITVVLLSAGTAIYLNSQNRNMINQSSITITSSQSSSRSTSSQAQSLDAKLTTSSTPTLAPAPANPEPTPQPVKVADTPKIDTTPVITQPATPPPKPINRGSNPNPIQDIPNVTKLSTDKSIYWQYIKDYLACPTKFYQPLNGGYTYDGLEGEYQYLCIPQSEIDKCPKGLLRYGLKNTIGEKIPVSNPRITKVEPTTKNPEGIIKELEIIELGKYYCVTSWEFLTSVSMPGVYFSGYFLDNLKESVNGYFVIPKLSLKNQIISFAAIPLESFSQEDQQYIANNFSVK